MKSLILALCFLNLNLNAQNFSFINQKNYGTSGFNLIEKVLLTNDLGFIVLSGLQQSNNDHSGSVYGGNDAWVIKLNGNKDIVWEKAYGGSQNDILFDCIEVSNGNLLLTGTSDSPVSGNKTVGTNGFDDYWAMMLDSLGNILWQKNFGTDVNDRSYGNSLIQINPNQYIISGKSGGGVNGDKTTLSNGGGDLWFVTIDSLGNKLADFSFGGDNEDNLSSVSLKSNGNLFVISSSSSGISGDKTSPVFGFADVWILECSSNGTLLQQNFYGGTGFELLGNYLEIGNEVILVGSSDSPISGNKTSPILGNEDGILIKLDSSLNIVSDESYGGLGSWSFFNNLSQLPNGDYVISGASRGSTNPYRTSSTNGANDAWILGFDSNLNYQWNYSFGGDSFDDLRALFPLSNNQFDVFVNSESSSFSGDFTVPNYGQSDIVYGRVDSDLFLNENNTEKISVYPNPSSTTIAVNSSLINLPYIIYNIENKAVLNGKYTDQIDISGLTSGVYFITFESKSEVSRMKFVKQ